MEQPNSSMVSGLRPAPVRLIVRDDATLPEVHRALEALRANLNEILDALPTRGAAVITFPDGEAVVSRNNGKSTGYGKPPVEHQFKPGNPGRPKGSRNKLGEAFIQALAEDFERHGAEVIERV